MEVKSLYIIKRDTGVCMYHHDFTQTIFDPQLISSFIVAMTSFFDEATHSLTSQARAFEGTDYKIIVEFGEWTLGALAVLEDTAEMRAKLKRIIDKFEKQFNILQWVDLDLAIYKRFEKVVIEEFIRELITPESVIYVNRDWDIFSKNADVRSMLRLIPDLCTVKDAAEFLEMPLALVMNLTAEAIWEKSISIRSQVRPDDIFQTTSRFHMGDGLADVSPVASKALGALDGETPLIIAAERTKTSDMKEFLKEIELLARRRAIERVSPAQAMLILHCSTLESILEMGAKILGYRLIRAMFYTVRKSLLSQYPWVSYIVLEDRVDVEIKGSLMAASIRGQISPDTLKQGLIQLLQRIAKEFACCIGNAPTNTSVIRAKRLAQKRFPSMAFEIEWEKLFVYG
ncbi:MAG: hypothetical protein BAJATHORv1_30341 [Candidatus Thorarchaeota archaeon]|nr:MAG: hypothetical protein BAJATHORv1_30341 [Candidatus Thorarchaeota archaeon]